MDIGIRRIPGIGGESEDDGRFTFPPEALDTMRHAAAMITMDRQRIVTDTSEADGARQARQFGFRLGLSTEPGTPRQASLQRIKRA